MTAPIPEIKKIANHLRYSPYSNSEEPTAEIKPPIRVKEIDMPITIEIGLNLLPWEPASTTGRMGRMQGVSTVNNPATKAIIIEGAWTIIEMFP